MTISYPYFYHNSPLLSTQEMPEMDEPYILLEANLQKKNEQDVLDEKLDDVVLDVDEDDASSSSGSLRRSDSQLSLAFADLSRLLLIPEFDFGIGFDTVSDSTKRRFQDMKLKTRQRLRKLKDDSIRVRLRSGDQKIRNAELIRIQERFLSQLSKLDKRVHTKLQSSSTEKLFYAVSVFLIAASGFIIGKYPTYFHIFHSVIFAVLMPIRFYTYFKCGYQFYLADLCYYVNLLLMAFIWWFPNSKTLFVSVFSLAMGTLSFAVITWRNSLVLHLIEKTTSSFIHIMPPVTLFVIVHELPLEFVAERFPAVAGIDRWNFINGILWTSVYYTAWQMAYHYFITIKRKEQIKKGLVTSFTYLKEKNSKSVLGRFVNSLPYAWMQIASFTLIQFGYQLLTMVFCPIWFKYKHACGAFVTFIFIWASYNGATYYIDVFGKRLEKEVMKLKTEIYELQQKSNGLEEEEKRVETDADVAKDFVKVD